MQVLLHADPNVPGRHHMSDHVETVVKEVLGRFDERITRVEAHLADVKGHGTTGAVAIQCTLEARLTGLEPAVVKDQASNAHQAIDGAVRKLKRAVEAEIGKHAARRDRTQSEAAPPVEPDE
jgi:ribosome-associated translation inhibitor RaiA